jgi:hypothetical protein
MASAVCGGGVIGAPMKNFETPNHGSQFFGWALEAVMYLDVELPSLL